MITDLVMPGIDGLEFVRRLKERAIPVIVFSGQGTIETAVEAVKLRRAGFPREAGRAGEAEDPPREARRHARAARREPPPARRAARARGVRPAARQLRSDPCGLPPNRAGGALHAIGPDRRRERNRQGARRPDAPRPVAAEKERVRRDQLRRDPGDPPRERDLRPRARGVHRRGSTEDRLLRDGASRDAVPRRDRGDGRDPPGEAASGAAGATIPARRRARRRSKPTCGSSPRRTATP